jgi:hypothetical protein
VSTVHLLNQVQRRIRLEYRLCSMAERRRAAGVCGKSEHDGNASVPLGQSITAFDPFATLSAWSPCAGYR